jgi:hypothetical protein
MRDGEIRHALLAQMAEKHGSDPATRVVSELSMCLGEGRVDVGVVNGVLSGFEIKSASDRLTRLPRQREVYERCLDFITIVTEEKWVASVADHVPDWWGIVVAAQDGGEVTLQRQRPSERNDAVDPLSLAQFLWRDEAAAVLHARGVPAPSRATRWDLWDLLVEHLPHDELALCVRDHLRARPARAAT